MELETRLRELSTLNAIAEILNREADFEAAVHSALKRLVSLLDLSTGWVFLTRIAQGDSHQGSFRLAASTGLPPALAQDGRAPLCQGNCDCQWRFRHGKLDQGVNIVHCSRLEAAAGDKGGLEFHASVPLLGQAGPVGIVNLAAPGSERFDAETLTFLTAVGRQLGVAFDRFRLQALRTEEARHLATLEERQRLATDMHDSVAQLLFAADLSLRAAREGAESAAREAALDRGAELVGAALQELRGLVEVLRPADLSHGLYPALRRLAQRTNAEVAVHYEAGISEPMSEPVAEALYRVAQEALHNALKHAGAANVWIRLEALPDGVRLHIEDDGRGMPEQTVPGLGLSSMRERVLAQGGTLRLLPRVPHGLAVEAEISWRG